VNRSLVAQMNANLPGTEGRRLRRHMVEAIWAQARPETGAAITEKEEQDMWTRFGPNIADNDAAVKEKLFSIKSLLARGISSIDPHGLHATASDKRYKDLMGDTSGPTVPAPSKEHKNAAQNAVAEAMKQLEKKKISPYGDRPDGTAKGGGYFGELPRLDDKTQFSTELSSSYEIDGKEILLPLIVPTLNKAELNHLLSGKTPTRRIEDKAIDHALRRIRVGKSPFADASEQQKPPTK
ncbi:MAG: hypothetical protein ACRCZI_15575, partial [Cetobacterium sp.]